MLSLDTYQIETIVKISELCSERGIDLWWNDISGDTKSARAVLKEFPKLGYVLCHNLAPDRSLAQSHMKFLLEGNPVEQLTSYFSSRIQSLAGLKNPLLLDPCFGFSKSRDQNLFLCQNLFQLVKQFSLPWVLGISRKSFLRPEGESYAQHELATELQHVLWLDHWQNTLPCNEYYLRLHNPIVAKTHTFWTHNVSSCQT